MRKTIQTTIKMDEKFVELIKSQAEGKNFADKCRNLMLKGLNVKPTLEYKTQGEN